MANYGVGNTDSKAKKANGAGKIPPDFAGDGPRELLAIGIDPMAQRKEEKTAEQVASSNSFATIAAEWLEHWREGKSLRHVDSVRRRMAADILPGLGSRPLTEIEAPELVAMTKAIEQRGARDIAKRALETSGQVFRYAIAHGYSKRNPASEIRPSDILKTVRKTNYARIDSKELPELLKKIEVYQGTHVTRLAMKLMALTFVRTSELIGARWGEFDFEAFAVGHSRIPDEDADATHRSTFPSSNRSLGDAAHSLGQ